MTAGKGSLSTGADLGKVYGDAARCPACGAFATVVPSHEHRWACGVCGAPRVSMPDGSELPEESGVAIREAADAQRTAALQRLVTWACGLPSAFTLLLAIALAPVSLLAGGVLVAAGIVLAWISARASRRAATERKHARSSADRAYEAAVGVLAKDKAPSEIAAALRISEADVETMLTMISAQAQVRVAVDPLAAALPEDSAMDREAQVEQPAAKEKQKA